MNTSNEERLAMAGLALKKILYSFPVAGPFLEVMFEFRGKVKQDRLNQFVEMLEKDLLKSRIDLAIIPTEENVDLIESILKKVLETRSTEKRRAFKNLLVRGFVSFPFFRTIQKYKVE